MSLKWIRPERFEEVRAVSCHGSGRFHVNVENSHFVAHRSVINIRGTVLVRFLIFAKRKLNQITSIRWDVVSIDFEDFVLAVRRVN